jgi:carboxyl-terminal processing protease
VSVDVCGDAARHSVAPLSALRLCALAGVAITLIGCVALPAGATIPTAAPPLTAVVAAITSAPTPTPRPSLPSPSPRPAPTERPTAIPSPTAEIPTQRGTPTELPILETPTPAALAYQERQQIFEEVWRTVDEKYLYPDFHGLDWNAVHEEYGAKLEQEQTRDQFYAMMIEMLALLDDQHSRFEPPAIAQLENAKTSNDEVTVGIGVLTKPRPDGAFIQIVFPDSPAARAEIGPRDRIIAVDGQPYQVEDGDLLGEAGSVVRLTVVRPGAKLRDVVLTRQEVRNHIVPSYRRFPGDIGYVTVPTLWVTDMHEQVNGALTDLVAEGRLNGLILDMRANSGGWSYVMSGLLSHFVRGQVGAFVNRQHVRPLEISPPDGPDLRGLPLVVLVDNETASYGEVLAAILQREDHALVVGTRSAGNTETIYATVLSDGSRLWLAEEAFRLQNGMNLEGVGVKPDSTVDVDWTHYSEDDDPQLLEALRLLGAGPK